MLRPRHRPVATLALLLLGCASAPRPPAPPQRVVLAGSAARNLLILPFNVAAAMPQELDAMSPVVWEELEVYLQARHDQLKTVNRNDARRLWVSSIREARAAGGSEAGYDEASRLLVEKLAHYADFDTVIAPSLFVRKAPIHDGVASWDGVKRELEIDAHGEAARALQSNGYLEGVSAPSRPRLEGVAPAASLHAVVFDARGNKLQEQIAGIEPLVRVHVSLQRSGAPAFEFETRTDLFANRDWVRQGIANALAPFIAAEAD